MVHTKTLCFFSSTKSSISFYYNSNVHLFFFLQNLQNIIVKIKTPNTHLFNINSVLQSTRWKNNIVIMKISSIICGSIQCSFFITIGCHGWTVDTHTPHTLTEIPMFFHFQKFKTTYYIAEKSFS